MALGKFDISSLLNTAQQAVDIYTGRSPTTAQPQATPIVVQSAPSPVRTRVVQAAQKVPWLYIGLGGVALLGTALFLKSRQRSRR
jgi:hypothetical protein